MDATMVSVGAPAISEEVGRRSPSVLQLAAAEFQALPAAHREVAATRLAERFAQACAVMPRRRRGKDDRLVHSSLTTTNILPRSWRSRAPSAGWPATSGRSDRSGSH